MKEKKRKIPDLLRAVLGVVCAVTYLAVVVFQYLLSFFLAIRDVLIDCWDSIMDWSSEEAKKNMDSSVNDIKRNNLKKDFFKKIKEVFDYEEKKAKKANKTKKKRRAKPKN